VVAVVVVVVVGGDRSLASEVSSEPLLGLKSSEITLAVGHNGAFDTWDLTRKRRRPSNFVILKETSIFTKFNHKRPNVP
jgi:hypothetical protein